MVLITAVLAWYAGNTLGVMQKQSWMMTKSMILTHRPKVIVRGFVSPEAERMHPKVTTMLELQALPDTLTGYFEAVNTGGALTDISRYVAGFHIRPVKDPLPMRFPEGVADPTNVAIELGSGNSTQIVLHPKQMSNDELNGVIELEKDVYILGWIDYKDRLGNTRRTAFGRKLRHELPRWFLCVEDSDYEYAD